MLAPNLKIAINECNRVGPNGNPADETEEYAAWGDSESAWAVARHQLGACRAIAIDRSDEGIGYHGHDWHSRGVMDVSGVNAASA